MLRCSECKKYIIKTIAYTDWLKVLHYFEVEYLQGDITQETYEAMTDALLTVKPKED